MWWWQFLKTWYTCLNRPLLMYLLKIPVVSTRFQHYAEAETWCAIAWSIVHKWTMQSKRPTSSTHPSARLMPPGNPTILQRVVPPPLGIPSLDFFTPNKQWEHKCKWFWMFTCWLVVCYVIITLEHIYLNLRERSNCLVVQWPLFMPFHCNRSLQYWEFLILRYFSLIICLCTWTPNLQDHGHWGCGKLEC